MAVIDDLADRKFTGADIVINPNFGVQQEAYDSLIGAASCVLSGVDFCIIRPEFLAADEPKNMPATIARTEIRFICFSAAMMRQTIPLLSAGCFWKPMMR